MDFSGFRSIISIVFWTEEREVPQPFFPLFYSSPQQFDCLYYREKFPEIRNLFREATVPRVRSNRLLGGACQHFPFYSSQLQANDRFPAYV